RTATLPRGQERRFLEVKCRTRVTKMRCFKLLGERVMNRDFDRQVAELQIRAALLNRFTRVGTPQTVRVA
ncbi:hypothetical protein ACFONG_16845, partial [Uliginosibacterium paludis]